MRLSHLTLITLGAFSSPAVFSADSPSTPDEMRTVSYAGLDLGTHAGAQAAYQRLRVAAQGVCRDLYTLELGQRRHIWQTCVNDAIARAVADIGAPALTAYAQTRMGLRPEGSKVAAND